MTKKVRSEADFRKKFGWNAEDVVVTDASGKVQDMTPDKKEKHMAKKLKRLKIPRDDLFENETPPLMVAQSEGVSEEEIDEEEAAIDNMLDGDDEAFDKLKY
jgi:hypothetical protein